MREAQFLRVVRLQEQRQASASRESSSSQANVDLAVPRVTLFARPRTLDDFVPEDVQFEQTGMSSDDKGFIKLIEFRVSRFPVLDILCLTFFFFLLCDPVRFSLSFFFCHGVNDSCYFPSYCVTLFVFFTL